MGVKITKKEVVLDGEDLGGWLNSDLDIDEYAIIKKLRDSKGKPMPKFPRTDRRD